MESHPGCWEPPQDAPLPAHEPWLDRWRASIGPPPRRVLDLGCGRGDDTRALCAWGYEVAAIDAAADAVAESQRHSPEARHHVLDLRDLPGPIAHRFDAVVASLSLHYFDEATTRRIFGAIRGLLAPDGFLAFRVNAADDFEYGATGTHDSWELVREGGRTKQFFTESKIRGLLDGWARIESLEKRATLRFGPLKSFYEVTARRDRP